MKLKLWQRIWGVINTLITLMVLFVLALAPVIYVIGGTPLTANLWLKMAAFAIGWPVVAYAIGLTIAWVIRGFRGL